MTIRVQEADFDVGAELASLRAGDARVGALASFLGLVRDMNDGSSVSEMTLEHYPGMTEKALEEIVVEARGRWDIYDALVIHRVGPLKPCDQIVLVAVTSAHRGEAFTACEFIMDYLKTRAPFWKREVTAAGARWVEARLADEQAAERWRDWCRRPDREQAHRQGRPLGLSPSLYSKPLRKANSITRTYRRHRCQHASGAMVHGADCSGL